MFERITDEQVKEEATKIGKYCEEQAVGMYGDDFNNVEALTTIATILMREIAYQRFQIRELSEKVDYLDKRV